MITVEKTNAVKFEAALKDAKIAFKTVGKETKTHYLYEPINPMQTDKMAKLHDSLFPQEEKEFAGDGEEDTEVINESAAENEATDDGGKKKKV